MSDTLRLFDLGIRTDTTPADHTEPIFDALNRLAWVNAERIRQVLEDWYAAYPALHKAQLQRRFRSRHDSDHQGAFLELLLFRFLAGLGCAVVVNPRTPSGSTPDFLATTPSGEEFYLEATVAEPMTLKDSPSEKQVLDALNGLDCSDYWLAASARGVLRCTPPLGKVQQTFQEWIDGLNYENVQDTHGRSGTYPRRTYVHVGWKLTLTAIPRSEAHRGKPGARPLAGISRADFVDSAKPLRNALDAKGKKCKDIGAPFMVAINTLDRAGVDHSDVLSALFGWEASTDEPDLARISRFPVSQRRGRLWDAHKNTGVSAILLFNELQPHAMAIARMCLYENPWASRPIPASLRRLPHAIADGEFMRWHQGETLGAILSLPRNWPGQK